MNETTTEDMDIICAFCGKRKSECNCRNTAVSGFDIRIYVEGGGYIK